MRGLASSVFSEILFRNRSNMFVKTIRIDVNYLIVLQDDPLKTNLDANGVLHQGSAVD